MTDAFINKPSQSVNADCALDANKLNEWITDLWTKQRNLEPHMIVTFQPNNRVSIESPYFQSNMSADVWNTLLKEEDITIIE